MENQYKKIKEKIIDFKRFGFTLMALSVFLYLGVVLPVEGKTEIQSKMLMAGTIVLIIGSLLFFYKAREYHNQLTEYEEDDER
ncbi:MAG: YrhC family protein [Bacillales bacterium]|nr:YrhC family protein [Bacillales bacterium]